MRKLARVCLYLLILLLLSGCASNVAPSAPAAPAGAPPPAARPEPRKTLTIAAGNTILGFGMQSAGTTGAARGRWLKIHSVGLATTDAKGALEGRLAAQLPSFNDGTMLVLPDGRLQATWKLRPNVRWHDGARFTAEDVVLGWKVTTTPSFPVLGSTNIRQMDRVRPWIR
jgi:peptide/nickel transport system substrate-binding protein